MRISLAIICYLFANAQNLLSNGDFEKGDRYPSGWQRPDDFSTFWVTDPKKGKCMKIDSSVPEDQWHERLEQMKEENPPAPPKPHKLRSPYQAIGANDGVPFFSEFVDIKPAYNYTLSIEAKNDGKSAAADPQKGGKVGAKIFVKGYKEFPADIVVDGKVKRVNMKRVAFKMYKDLDLTAEWQKTSFSFCPTLEDPEIKWIRVMIYVYWPAGIAYFDNVELKESGKNELAETNWKKIGSNKREEEEKKLLSEIQQTKALLKKIREALEMYKLDNATYPTTEQGLRALWEEPQEDPKPQNWRQYIMEVEGDYWGNRIHYRFPGKKDPAKFDLISPGLDGELGTADDVE